MSSFSQKKFSHFEWSERNPRHLSHGAFLDVSEYQVRHCFSDGSHGPFYAVEAASPPCLDAVVLIIYTLDMPIQVLLRNGMRPAAAVRTRLVLPLGSDQSFPEIFWELPTGGVELHDWDKGALAGLQHRSQQECWEETGLHLPAGDFFELGPSPFPTAAFSPERLHFMANRVTRAIVPDILPPGDGHPMEEGSWVEWVELETALAWCRNGAIVDSKTELGLRRLQEFVAGRY